MVKSSSLMRPKEAAPVPSPRATSMNTTELPRSIASMTLGSGPVVVDSVAVDVVAMIESNNSERRQGLWRRTYQVRHHCVSACR